jgi:hypothetical protein
VRVDRNQEVDGSTQKSGGSFHGSKQFLYLLDYDLQMPLLKEQPDADGTLAKHNHEQLQ